MSGAVGIDLGSSTTVIFEKKKRIILRQPSVIAAERESGEILAFGKEAEKMLGRTPDNICALMPIRSGVVSDFEMCVRLLREYMKPICAHRLTRPDVIFSVPSSISLLEERALIDAAVSAGAKRVFLTESVFAAAIGAGVDFSKPEGRAVLDIGGGTCDIGVLSLGSVVESLSIKIAGESFDNDIIRYVRKNRNILLGSKTAEEIKIKIGALTPRPQPCEMKVRGKSLSGNFIGECTINSEETLAVLKESADRIIEGIHSVFEKIPPELMADISASGITLTGGGSLLWGLDSYIENQTGIKVRLSDDSAACAACGLGKLAANLSKLSDGSINLERKKRLNLA